MKIKLKSGIEVNAKYIRHLRTLTAYANLGGRSQEVDEVEVADGTRIAVQSDEIDSRQTPWECGTPDQYQ